MAIRDWSAPTRRHLPIILVRGFGGLDVEDEKALAYQGFNVGSVYPHKRGENYIYEGLILRLLKHRRRYFDATNVVEFHAKPIVHETPIPEPLSALDHGFFTGHKVVINPAMALRLLQSEDDPTCTLWVFRYYDLDDRAFEIYGEALARLIDFIRALIELKTPGTSPKVNIVAHSMGGLIVREAVQRTFAARSADAADQAINKIVTLGTPHRGISFQVLEAFRWLPLDAGEELWTFNPDHQDDPANPASFKNFGRHFPLERLLTVVGTNYRTYSVRSSSWLNRLFSVGGEFGPNYNRSDGLVQQTYAQIDGALRTFVHKCHGGYDSLVTSRETFEIAARFLHGNVRARLRLLEGEIKRGFDWFGKSEFFFGASIKPRGVDFELFHQSKEAENCYGPFTKSKLHEDGNRLSFGWADADRLIWQGYLDVDAEQQRDLVVRVDLYLGERDLYGLGFSDNVVLHKQYYVRVIFKDDVASEHFKDRLEFYQYTGEQFAGARADDVSARTPMPADDRGWLLRVDEDGFEGTFRIELDLVPIDGEPQPLLAGPQPEGAVPV